MGVDTRVRLTAVYVSWILVPTETSFPPPALDPHSLSVPPCLPVCYSVCVNEEADLGRLERMAVS